MNAVAQYFRGQIAHGRLILADPERAAALFTQMVERGAAGMHVVWFHSGHRPKLDFQSHIDQVVEIFLNGAAPRAPAEQSGA